MSEIIGARWRIWLMAIGMASCGIGCKSPGIPADPMFISRKPVEAKAESASPVAVVYAEPVLPPDPVMVVVAPPSSPTDVAHDPGKPSGKNAPRKVPGILTNQPAQESNGPLMQVIPPTIPHKPD
jgi:hypothetical protein